jgi:DNA-binding transcriptional MerR regulator
LDKAPDAFRTISEVADDLDVPQHVLRFWETRFAQIKPMKRSGGRRYYRREDVELLRGIRQLLYGQGYTIRGVQRILREQGIKAVQGFDGGIAGRAPPLSMSLGSGRAEADEHDDAAEEFDGEISAVTEDSTPPALRIAEVVARASRSEARPTVVQVAVAVPPPAPAPERVVTVVHKLSAEDAGLLRSVLDDLLECRRVLDRTTSPA